MPTIRPTTHCGSCGCGWRAACRQRVTPRVRWSESFGGSSAVTRTGSMPHALNASSAARVARTRPHWRSSDASTPRLRRRWCGLRIDPEQRRLIFVRQHVQRTVRADTHVADALMQLSQHRFAPDLFPALVEHDAVDLSGARHLAFPQSADKQIVLPRRHAIVGIERHPARGNRGYPDDDWHLHPVTGGLVGNARAHVAASVRDNRPAIVLAGTNDINLVTAIRPLFGCPHLTSRRVHREAKLIAVPPRVDCRLSVGPSDKRLIRWNFSLNGELE